MEKFCTGEPPHKVAVQSSSDRTSYSSPYANRHGKKGYPYASENMWSCIQRCFRSWDLEDPDNTGHSHKKEQFFVVEQRTKIQPPSPPEPVQQRSTVSLVRESSAYLHHYPIVIASRSSPIAIPSGLGFRSRRRHHLRRRPIPFRDYLAARPSASNYRYDVEWYWYSNCGFVMNMDDFGNGNVGESSDQLVFNIEL